jgi:hypothetical protein
LYSAVARYIIIYYPSPNYACYLFVRIIRDVFNSAGYMMSHHIINGVDLGEAFYYALVD